MPEMDAICARQLVHAFPPLRYPLDTSIIGYGCFIPDLSGPRIPDSASDQFPDDTNPKGQSFSVQAGLDCT